MKRIMSLALAFLMMVSLAACGSSKQEASEAPKEEQSEQSTQETQYYSVGTASSGGMMYAIGSGWASLMNDVTDGKYQFTAEETAGNTANIAMIESGELEFCCNGIMSLYEGYEGTAEWTGGTQYKNIRVMFPMNQMVLTAYTLSDTGITTLSDLNGKVVGLGSKGGAMDSLFRQLFDILGIVPADIYNDGWAATVSALSDGTIDAGITMQLAPAAALVELQATKDVTFLTFSDEELDTLKELNPAFSDSVIAAGSYNSITEDIKTVGDIAVMCCSADMPDDVVYDLVKTTFEHQDDMRLTHNAMANWSIERAASVIAQYHPGALKYYDEMGITIPEPTVVPHD